MAKHTTAIASLALASLAAVTDAAAQSATGGFQLDRYVLPMQANDLFWTERPSITPHFRVGLIAALGYQSAPLTVRRGDRGSETTTLVANDLRGHVGIGIGLFDRVQVGVALPIVLYTNGDAQPGGGSLTHSAFGDLRADLRVRLLGANTGAGARLAVAGSILLPLGNPAAYAGDGYVTGSVRALLEYEFPGGVRLGLNAGVVFRPTLVFSGDYSYTVDDEGFARLGLTVPVTQARDLLATLELAGATALAYTPGFFARYYSHLEALAGAKYITDSGAFIGIAAGAGLSAGVGTPDARAIIMVGRGYTDPSLNSQGPGDSDRDGVVNSDDRCIETPMGAHPDPDRPGCPSQDDDRDGYINQLDNCPAESAGAHPDLERVGCPLRDSDGDTVFDPRDQCPQEPRGEHPDGARPGCPIGDRDGDTVLDDRDACPENPGEPAAESARNGCAAVAQVEPQQILTGDQLYFAANRELILPRSFPMLQEVVRIMAARPEIQVLHIEGHTDRRGGRAHNMALSGRRAASVRAWLIAQGVAPERLTSAGLGPTRPVVDDSTAEGRARNRRVEFHIISTRALQTPPVGHGAVHAVAATDRPIERAHAATMSTQILPAAAGAAIAPASAPTDTLRGAQ